MNFRLPLVLALLASVPVLAQEPAAAAPAAVQPAGFQVVKIKLAPSQAGDPKTVHPKALVGRGTIAGREYTLVFDGTKADGDLDAFRLLSRDPAETFESKLLKSGSSGYGVARYGWFLPGQPELMVEGVRCELANDEWQAQVRVCKACQGVCDFAGEKLEVLVIDRNHNDRLGDLGSQPCDKDGYPTTQVLYNSAGKQPAEIADLMVIPKLNLMVSLGQSFVVNERLWTLTIADGKMTLIPHPGKMAKIRWTGSPQEIPFLSIRSKSPFEVGRPNCKEGWLMPAGDYRLRQYGYRLGESLTSPCVYCRYEEGGVESYQELKLQPGQILDLGPVAEAVARIVVKPMAKERQLSLVFEMSAPDRALIHYYKNSMRQPEARELNGFRIIDAAGKEILRQQYTDASGCFIWPVPADLKGTFTAEPVPAEEKPPFKVTVEKTVFTL